MRIPRLHVEQDLEVNSLVQIEGKRAHYISKVLRMDKERELILFNGSGRDYQAIITAVTKKTIDILVRDAIDIKTESNLKTTLAIAVSKGDRMDWAIQKTTELGITSIQPLFTERGEVKLKEERLQKKVQHWQQVSISACEQSQRSVVPQLLPPLAFGEYIITPTQGLKLLCDFGADTQLAALAQPTQLTFLIGPEGGLSTQESELAIHHNFTPITLGPRTMRTETAPVAMLTLAQFLWGDL